MFTTDEIVFASNVVWALAALSVAGIMAWRLAIRWRRWRVPGVGSFIDETVILMTGICYVAFWTAMHRVYWAGWRFFRAHGEADIAQHFVDWGTWTNVFIVPALVGYGLHKYPLLRPILGRFWWAIYAGLLSAIWLLLASVI